MENDSCDANIFLLFDVKFYKEVYVKCSGGAGSLKNVGQLNCDFGDTVCHIQFFFSINVEYFIIRRKRLYSIPC